LTLVVRWPFGVGIRLEPNVSYEPATANAEVGL
jgi:hypothetical protein